MKPIHNDLFNEVLSQLQGHFELWPWMECMVKPRLIMAGWYAKHMLLISNQGALKHDVVQQKMAFTTFATPSQAVQNDCTKPSLKSLKAMNWKTTRFQNRSKQGRSNRHCTIICNTNLLLCACVEKRNSTVFLLDHLWSLSLWWTKIDLHIVANLRMIHLSKIVISCNFPHLCWFSLR